MSNLEKKLEEELEKIENAIEKELKTIGKKVHQHNLFPLMAGGVSVFLLMVSMVVVAPYMLLLDVPPSSTAHEYTTLEAKGRSLFMSLGCFYCHSQQVRPSDWAMGNVSQQGDFVYDSPHALGTERSGPDLAQIGGMRPTMWHYLHYRDPRSVSPGSIMPNFGFLSNSEIEALTTFIQNLGQENLYVQASITNGSAYHPIVPEQYLNASNPFTPTMTIALGGYDVQNDVYNGDPALGNQWGDQFDAGKIIFAQKCISCHGGSGNSQGPYARHVVTQPANLHERIATFASEAYHLWRVSEGVPGTAMPAWKLSLNSTEIDLVAVYELSFVFGSPRTISGDISDAEGDNFANSTLNSPPIAGTFKDFENGKNLFTLYCAQCHGNDGQGDGPASIKTNGGYITPKPANFTESGGDFQLYGRYVWKVKEGVETTNMPPWKWALNDYEMYQAVFYVQSFSTTEDYNTKWGPQYSDPFAQNLKNSALKGSFIPDFVYNANPALPLGTFAAVMLWVTAQRETIMLHNKFKGKKIAEMLVFRRNQFWI